MKKFFNILGLLLIIFGLTACVNFSKETQVNENSNPEIKEDQEIINDETTIDDNQTSENIDNVEETKEKQETIVTCVGDQGRGAETLTFYFENDSIYKYVHTLEIPEQYDAQDFYQSEEIMNSGRYKMSLEGRTIIEELDPSMAFWNDWPYKDETYTGIYKIWTEYNFSCEG